MGASNMGSAFDGFSGVVVIVFIAIWLAVSLAWWPMFIVGPAVAGLLMLLVSRLDA